MNNHVFTAIIIVLLLFGCSTDTWNDSEVSSVISQSGENKMYDGVVFKLTLDNQGAATFGSEQIYLKYNDGYYLERFCETQLGEKSSAIVCPIKYGYRFFGYNTEKSGNGQTIINSKGLINVDVSYNTFKADTTLYAIWKTGYESTSALLSSLFATLSPNEEPYEIRILDNNPDLSVIKNVLNSYKTLKVNLDLSLCTRLQSIESGAFNGCGCLVGITIPSSVTSINSESFSNCESLASIIVDKDNTMYDSRENCNAIMESSTNTLVLGCCNSFIPNGTRIIRSGAFANCKGLENVTIPDSVINIGDSAFSGCSGLTDMTIGDGVTSIGSNAFNGCSELTTLSVKMTTPPSLNNDLYSCYALTTIYVPSESVAAYKEASGWKNYNSKIAAIGSNLPNMVSVSELSSYVATVSSDKLSEIIITDNNPDLSAIKTILQKCPEKKILLNLRLCLGLTEIQKGELDDCTSLLEMYYPSSLTSLVVPNTVNRIGDNAFYNNMKLISIEIPDSVTTIGSRAFNGCSGLKSLVIGSGITLIPQALLYGCSSLDSITIPFLGDKPHTSEDSYQYPFGYIFGTNSYDGGTKTTQYYYGNITTSIDYYIPNSLKSLTITGSNYIPRGAFYNCSGLTSVTIGNEVTSIGYSAFSNCSGLTNVTIGNGVTSIGSNAFYNCNGLNEVDYTGTIDSWCGITFDGYESNPIYYAHNLYINGELVTDLVIPNTVTEIKSYAFYNCNRLTSMTIPDSVTSIDNRAFSGCSRLASVTIESDVDVSSASLNFIKDNIRYQILDKNSVCVISNSYLGNVVIPSTVNAGNTFTVTSIGNSAFYNCNGLTSMTIPGSITSIGRNAFYNCNSLTSVTIPSSVTIIDSNAFYNCSRLASVTIESDVDVSSASLNFIKDNIRYQILDKNSVCVISNSYLGNVVIPSTVNAGNTFTVTSIDESAFYNCNGLTSVTIPDSVTRIGNSAFSGCSALTTITIKAITPPRFYDYNLSYYCPNLTTIYVSSESVSAYKTANGWSNYADKIRAIEE